MKGKSKENKIEQAPSIELLYRISKAMAAVKDGRELLKIIVEETQPVFGFYDIGLSVLDKSAEFYTDWAVYYAGINPSEANLAQREINLYQFPADEPLMKHAVARAEKEKKPFIENMTAEFIAEFKNFPHLPLEIALGYQQFLVTTLKFGGKTLGVLNFNSQRENHFESCDFELFQAIADLVAVAVGNIQANEEILEQTREKALLLAVSEDIAAVRDKRDLLQTIIGKVKPLFGFYDCGIMILDKNRRRFHDWAVLMPDIDFSPANDVLAEKGFYRDGGIAYENSLLQNVIAELEQAGQPIFWDYEKKRENLSDGELIVELRKLGYKHGVATLLRTGGEIIGAFFINSMTRDFFRREQFGLLQGVADQIAVAVSNVLANEEISERTREKSRLLEITELIAQVKANDDLLRLIVDKIRPLFGFEDCGLFVVSADKKTHRDLAAAIPGVSPSEFNERIAAVIPAHDLPHSASVVEAMMREIETAGKPVLLDFVDLVEQFPDYPQFIGTGILDLGYRDCLAANLVVRGESIGMFCINARRKDFFQPQIFPLFQAVAHSISIAVANILANEEILERTREKSVLLSISEDIASARNAVELMQVIREKAQRLIPFYDTGILIVEDDGKHHYDLAVNMPGWDDSDSNRKLHDLGLHRMAHPDSYVECVMNLIETQKNPVIENYERRFEEFDYPFFQIMNEIGYKEAIVTTLKSGGRTFGTLWLNSLEKNHFSPIQFEVFQTLADQVAVAVANILANEEILEREREKSVLLSISEAIATVRDKDELFGIFNQKLRPILGYDYASVLEVDSARKNYRYYLTISDQLLEANELYKEAARFRPYNPYIENALQSAIPETYLTDELLKQYPNGAGLKLQQSLGVKQSVVFVLKNAGQTIGLFILHYKALQNIKPEQLPLFRSIANQIAVALGNILANEEIERQLDEIKKLKTQLEVDNKYLVEEVKTNYNFEEIIGAAPKLQIVFEQIELVAPTNATVLLEGETGTGKELFARAIHNLSPRSTRPLIKVNCACLPSNLVESELFGHERGSFTGATERRVGKFELAHNSTIFLDEIGELPLELQAKLLRVLQEQELERIGGKSPFKLDIRVIAATNRNLREEVAARRFRSDLYFRLNTVTLNLPPLRERREDVPSLAMHFVEKYSNRTGRRVKSVATNALQELMSYDFPGNIRELEHLIEESVIFCKNEKLVLHRPLRFDNSSQTVADKDLKTPAATTLADHEREHILTILRQTDGRIRGASGAAEILNIKPTTLEARMKRLGIEKRHIFERF